MQAKVTWLNDVTFVGESGSGHALVMDGSPDAGGRNIGIRPMEAVLIGMGGCAAFDVVTILKKSRAAARQCWVELRAQRADDIPKVFTHISMHFVVQGSAMKDNQVERAVNLSAKKYCSATAMIEKTAVIDVSYEVRNEDPPA